MERNKKKGNAEQDEQGNRLDAFIAAGNVEEAKLLAADPNCNVNLTSSSNCLWTPLMRASNRGYIDVVKVLLRRQDLLINKQNNFGDTALIWALYRRNTICAKLLLNDLRNDVNFVDDNGRSALWYAYAKGCTHIMKLLISRGANVEGITESVFNYRKEFGYIPPKTEATEVMDNWKLYLPEFTRFAKTNKYYPTNFKEWAFNFILCCLRSRSFPKDIIYLLLEYIARAWKRI